MNNDFRKFATGHLGMNGQTFDDVMKVQSRLAMNFQSQYLNPYILEERQLNVTQMDVFSRLMMDRIIFLGIQQIPFRHSCYILTLATQEETSLYISTLLAVP